VKPFLLLALRAEDRAADEEYAAFLRESGLQERELRRVRMEAAPLPDLDLGDYAGVILGGGPFQASDPDELKSDVQRRVEAEVAGLLDEIVARDLPFLGACYGIGTLGLHQGGTIDKTYAEPISAVQISLTAAGVADPVFAGVSERFEAFVGHKEACTAPPPTAVVLAGSAGCPVQAFRVKTNVYATQFHPELDTPGIITRVHVYEHAGYFAPAEKDALIERLGGARVSEPGRVLGNFVARYA
jgi:GMP synthase (glutamine-hydrolysing)